MADAKITMAQQLADAKVREAESSVLATDAASYVNAESRQKIAQLESRLREAELSIQGTRTAAQAELQRAQDEHRDALVSMEHECSSALEQLEGEFASNASQASSGLNAFATAEAAEAAGSQDAA